MSSFAIVSNIIVGFKSEPVWHWLVGVDLFA